MKKKLFFYFFSIFVFVVFLFQFNIFTNNSKYDFFVLRSVISPVDIILDMDTNNNNNILIKTDNEYSVFKNNGDILYKTIFKKVKNIDILINKKIQNQINGIIVFNGLKPFYFRDINNFSHKTFKNCNNNICATYERYSIPTYLKDNKKNDYFNSFSILNYICVLIMSIFLSNPYMILSYFLIFCLFYYYIKNKDTIGIFKINRYFIFGILFLCAILLRLDNLFYTLPWGDELASLYYSDANFFKTVADAGNPPAFYIIFYFYLKVFKSSLLIVKIFPFIISLCFLYVIWFFAKKEFNIKTANILLCLSSINIPLIYYSQEIRSYILQTLFSVLLVYFLFKILRKPNIKYYSMYLILGILAINTHYFECLFLLFNLVYGLFFLCCFKKSVKVFILINSLIFLSFVPYFIHTSLNRAILNFDFNTWIPVISFELILKCCGFLFGGLISLIFAFIFFIKINLNKKYNLKRKLYINYCFYCIAFVFIASVLISFYRPILTERYLTLLIPVFLIFLSVIFSSCYKNKNIIPLFLLWVFLIQTNTYVNNIKTKYNTYIPITFANQYYLTKKSSENLYVILNCIDTERIDISRYIKLNKNIKYISSLDTKKINEIIKKDKNAVMFTIAENDYNSTDKKCMRCYISATGMYLLKIY